LGFAASFFVQGFKICSGAMGSLLSIARQLCGSPLSRVMTPQGFLKTKIRFGTGLLAAFTGGRENGTKAARDPEGWKARQFYNFMVM
jgi:hypothetical protein